MASLPQVTKPEITMDDDGSYIIPDDPSMPGWSVIALQAEGKLEEARAECSCAEHL